MDKNKEIELKFMISKSNLKKMFNLDCITSYIKKDSCQKRRLVSSYYDTEDWSFKERHIAYRVRDKGNGTFEATVKTSSKNNAGLSERLELNLPLKTNKPVLEGFAELGLGFELSELASAGVKKLFTVNVERTTYILEINDTIIEIAVDNGKIISGRKTDKVDELEMELVEGDVSVLLSLAKDVARQVPLFVEKRSKFARGLALCGIELNETISIDKMGDNFIYSDLLATTEKCTDVLLDMQNILCQRSMTPEELKELWYQMVTLRSNAVFLEKMQQNIADFDMLQKGVTLVENLRALSSLINLWDKLFEEKPFSARNSLGKKLDEIFAAKQAALQELAKNGYFTALAYEQLQSIYCWHDAPNVISSEIIRTFLKDGRRKMQIAEVADNLWVLAHNMQGKYFIKFIGEIKKSRRTLRKQAQINLWYSILQEIAENSSSKLLYRDIGFVLGYLTADK